MVAVDSLINSDCMKILPEISDGFVTLTITDIPYDVVTRRSNGLRNFDKKDADILTFDIIKFVDEIVRVTSGSIYIFCAAEQMSTIKCHLNKLSLSTRLCILQKTNPSPINGQHIWLSNVECCVYGKKKGATFNEHCKGTVFKYPSSRNKHHPTEKPLKLMEYLINVSSNANDIVLDPCFGSGNVLISAKKLGRKYIGIELSDKYYNIALGRINNYMKFKIYENLLTEVVGTPTKVLICEVEAATKDEALNTAKMTYPNKDLKVE